MNVKEIIQKFSEIEAETVNVTGWLTLVRGYLYLLDFEDVEASNRVTSNFNENSLEFVARLKINNNDIAYVIRDCIMPLGGGYSFIFHRSRMSGILSKGEKETVEISPLTLAIEDSIGEEYKQIKLDDETISSAKAKHQNLPIGEKSINITGDWLD
ncbi:hypothetical protein [Rhizobium lusitanum]|uniref:hypothetical protein n=1 Tax=Rhizobium lusitanum TaxID=293958 RepID=UPI00195B9126|nr:hypothetical protein [Rhizobium lusitanum]MBM7045761.1 hypothetical protein [Rhizobium lusitanum]